MIRSVSFIGAGNVAWHLAKALKQAGINIVEICSQHLQSAQELATQVNAKAVTLNELNNKSDLYIIAIADDAIVKVAGQVKPKNGIVVHTSGSIGIDTLKICSNNIGVFYPLQTFSKQKNIDLKSVPFCIEGNNSSTEKSLIELASKISNNVNLINSNQRKQLHLAAVFACNFSNHCYQIADELLNSSGLKLDLLFPLIKETASKIETVAPKNAQTGPAIRHDEKVIQEHINLLKDHPDYQNLYKFVTQSIQKSHE